MTNCDQIVVEAARLKALFTECTSLKAMDLRAVVDLIESVNACDMVGDAPTLQSSYDNSIQPQMVTSTAKGSLQIKGGTGVNTDLLLEGKNNAGATTSSIDGNGVATNNGLILKTNVSAPSNTDGAQYKLTQPTTTGQSWSTTYNPVLSVSNGLTDYVRNKPATFRKKIMVIGSSVAFGQGATANYGWANRLGAELTTRGWLYKNHSIPGNTTQAVIDRFYKDVVPENPDVLIIGLSLGNEGIGGAGKEAVYDTFKKNLQKLVLMCRQQDIIPVIGSNYGSNGYGSAEYRYIQQINKEIDSWGVISIDFLGATNDLSGKFVAGSYVDTSHPNDVGHQEMFKSVPLSLFDCLMSLEDRQPGAKDGAIRIGSDVTTEKPIESVIDGSLSSFTVSFWFKSNDGASYGKALAGFGNSLLRVANTVGIGLRVVDTAGNTGVVFNVAPDVTRVWYNVTISYNSISKKVRCYLDGVFYGEFTDTVSADYFVLGGRGDSGAAGATAVNSSNTDFKNLAIYRTRLTDAQIKELYSGNILKSSLEVFSPLSDKITSASSRLLNLAPTYSYLKVNSSSFTAMDEGKASSGATENLQKTITHPADFTGTNYTLTSSDDKYEIVVNNGATAVTITVPGGLTSKIGVGFTQKGTGDVSYVASGTVINNPIGLKIKGRFYQTFLSQEGATNNYFLGGNTKV